MKLVKATAMTAGDLYDLVLSSPGPFLIVELHPSDDPRKLRKRLSAAASYRGKSMRSTLHEDGLKVWLETGH